MRFKNFCEMANTRRLVIYDFDGTLFRSPDKEQGSRSYKAVMNFDWPHQGWWGRLESLTPPVVPARPDASWFIQPVLEAQRRDVASGDATVVLMTGRPFKLKQRVLEILRAEGLNFDDHFFHDSPGNEGDTTLDAKVNRIGRLLGPSVQRLEIWEDRDGQIEGFNRFKSEMAKKRPDMEFVIHDAKQHR